MLFSCQNSQCENEQVSIQYLKMHGLSPSESFLLFCRFSVLSNSERIVASFGGHVASRFYPLEGLIIIIIIIIIIVIIIITIIITIIIKNQIYITLKYKIF